MVASPGIVQAQQHFVMISSSSSVVGRRSVGLSFDNSIIVLSININQFYTVGAGASPLNPHQVQQTDYGP